MSSSNQAAVSGPGDKISGSAQNTDNHKRLEGKVALITGGATGIGESIVKFFRQHGAKVCVVDIQDDLGMRVCQALGGDDDSCCFFHCDVTCEDDVRAAVDFAVEKFGGLDIMVNNAGIIGRPIRDIREIDSGEFQAVFDVNVKGVFFGMKHAARVMIPRGKGSIVSVASVASELGGMGPHAYTGSKHAVVGLTKNVAAELGQHGIRVNAVSPYAIPTQLSLQYLPEAERREDLVKAFQSFVENQGNLKGVVLETDDIAKAVVFIASDEARYVSGQNLVVDGGFTRVLNPLYFLFLPPALFLSLPRTVNLSQENMPGTTSTSGDLAGTGIVKFLCSYAGKILPRYPDGRLRYVGGLTRVLAVDRSVTFSVLAVKMAELCGEAVVNVRCQLPTEDLDALISVTCDEDLKNLIEEYDQANRERASPLKIKTFLSPRKPKTPPTPPKNTAKAAGKTGPIINNRCMHQIPPPVRFPGCFMLPVDKSAGTLVAVEPYVQYYARLSQGNPSNWYFVHKGCHTVT